MNPMESTPPVEHDDEVSALVEILLKTGQRLEELTAGEVDAVVDRDGRTLLLRGTQEQLRRGESARQGAILNALPAAIVLLDNNGEIKTVNDSWQRFAIANHMLSGLGNGIGVNYLDVCDKARGDGSTDAHLSADGIRSVLNGGRKSFSLEYSCNSPSEQRWFLLTVTPLADGRPSGAVVMHIDITASKQAESKLLLLAERLSLATSVAGVGVWEWELASNTLTWDRTMFAIYGFATLVAMPYERWSAAVHPEDLSAVEATLRKAIAEKGEGTAEFRIILENGTVRSISAVEKVVLDQDGKVSRVIGVNVDVTDRKLAEESLRSSEARMTHLAEHDFLTGLPNRMLLNDRIGRTIEFARRNKKKLAVLFLDMDGFKHINDSLGHPIGDMLIQAIGKRLVDCVRASDTVSRQGGDEFIVLIPEVEHPEGTAAAARRMLEAVASVHSIAQHELQITCCIGASIYPDDGPDAETLIKSADLALYQAKETGQSSYQFFQPAMNVRAVERQFIEENLRRALSQHEFALHYQPIVNLKTQTITGAEALIRWNHPTRGLISPGEFIPIAEDSGLILPIGSWVLEESCRQVRAWMDAGLPELTMAVNVSGLQFQSGNFAEDLFAILFEIGLDPRFLELEVTESLLMKRPDFTASILQTLRERGVQIAIDDFGTGYSSLSYLTKLPLDTLKIDQSFVRQITTIPNETSIVTAIVSMGQSLKLRVIAEGVETVEELKFLQALGCDEAQGYLFSRPVTSDKFEALVVRQSVSETLWPGIPNFSQVVKQAG
jgi:diguanylate cyclase (GGDEF)-like protein/PAS domain S-box-containing protein